MSNSVAPAVKTANDEIPWNPKVRQKKQPADYVVDFLIGLLVVAVVIVVLYPLWFIVIASFSNASLVSQGGVTLFPKGIDFAGYAKILDDGANLDRLQEHHHLLRGRHHRQHAGHTPGGIRAFPQ